MRYFFHISYKGTSYRGWQRQPKAVSVQAVLEDRLSSLLKKQTSILGCGRTDALVHASQYFFHIDTELILDDAFLTTLNLCLPAEIAVHEIISVEEQNHAQHSAIERRYDYFFHTSKDPFLSDFSAYYPSPILDLKAMKSALPLLLGLNDFRAVCVTPDRHNNTFCEVRSIQLFQNSRSNRFRLQITSDRFLRGMIRIIAGKLLEIGTGKLSIADFEILFRSKQAPQLLNQAYPQGLHLTKITYPFLNIEPKTDHFMMHQVIEDAYWIPV